MPCSRKTDKHLPPNVYYIDYESQRKKKNTQKHKGAYYFRPYAIENGKKKRKKILLGYNYQQALAKWAQLTEINSGYDTLMNKVLDRYMIEISPLKAPATHYDEVKKVAYLRKVFGEMYIDEIEPQDIYRYLDWRGQEGATVRANRELALLSHVFSKSIRWGLVKTNPCLNIERFKETPRKRYIEDWEFIAIRTWTKTPPILKVLMGFMYAGGRRRCELLPLNIASTISDEGIKIYDPKAKEWLIWEWDDALHVLYKEALSIPGKIKSFYLFANKRGKPYQGPSLARMFRKVILEAIKEGIIKEPFRLHDCRAKASSDLPSVQEACELLNHSSTSITERVYRRKVKRVKTLKGANVVLENKGGPSNAKTGS